MSSSSSNAEWTTCLHRRVLILHILRLRIRISILILRIRIRISRAGPFHGIRIAAVLIWRDRGIMLRDMGIMLRDMGIMLSQSTRYVCECIYLGVCVYVCMYN
jgi:hypothetical protein